MFLDILITNPCENYSSAPQLLSDAANLGLLDPQQQRDVQSAISKGA
jgi:hypothetical protein